MWNRLKLPADNLFFTADLHLGHTNIIQFCSRPWKHCDEMDQALIDNWNATVPENGTTVVIGDLAFRNRLPIPCYLHRLNGDIIWVHGNHDKTAWQNRELFKYHAPQIEIEVLLDKDKQLIVCNHYAMRVWNKNSRGSWHLYGHSHGNMENQVWGKSFDVGVDSKYTNYRPLSVWDVKAIMDTRPIYAVDHHGGG